MSLAAIAVAIAGLLIEDSRHSRGQNVRILYNHVAEFRGVNRSWKRALRWFAVKRRHRLFRALREMRSRAGCGDRQAQPSHAQYRPTKDYVFRSHTTLTPITRSNAHRYHTASSTLLKGRANFHQRNQFRFGSDGRSEEHT